MKLVIDINEGVYKSLKENEHIIRSIGKYNGGSDGLKAQISILNATPLTDCGDAISRENATNTIAKTFCIPKPHIEACLSLLPSVNPTTDTKTISTDSGKWVYNTTAETLAEIRAEIETKYPSSQCSGELTGYAEAVEDFLQIIDKYSKGGE